MRARAGAFALFVCGCGDTSTAIDRGGDVIRDGGSGGVSHGAGGVVSAGTAGTAYGGGASKGGASNGGATNGGASAAGSSGRGAGGISGSGGSGRGGGGGSVDAGSVRDAAPDVGWGATDGGCLSLPRSQAPDTSQYCTAVLCKVASGWEIVVSDPRGFYVGHLFWVLQIGDQTFIETRYVGSGLTQVAFAFSDSDFLGLAPGESLHASYGRPATLDAGLRGRYCGDFERP